VLSAMAPPGSGVQAVKATWPLGPNRLFYPARTTATSVGVVKGYGSIISNQGLIGGRRGKRRGSRRE